MGVVDDIVTSVLQQYRSPLPAAAPAEAKDVLLTNQFLPTFVRSQREQNQRKRASQAAARRQEKEARLRQARAEMEYTRGVRGKDWDAFLAPYPVPEPPLFGFRDSQ